MVDRSMNGCLRGKKDVRDYRFQPAMAIQYPTEYRCLNIPEVKDQGLVGSCVAHATAEILESHDKCKHTLSTNFIYGIHKKLFNSDGPGMYLREACKIVKEYGDPEYKFCPDNTEVEEVYEIAEKAFKDIPTRNNACEHRIKGYAGLFSDDEIKYALLNHGPVLASVVWYKDNSLNKNILAKGIDVAGLHAIMIYGWNENGFICQNSWGSYWGRKGTFILPYDYGVDEAYSFIVDKIEDSTDIVIPKRSNWLDLVYKFVNFILNLFNIK